MRAANPLSTLVGPIVGLVFLINMAGCARQAGFPASATPNHRGSDSNQTESENRKTPAQIQLEVMDFSDRFVAATGAAIEQILVKENDPERRVALLAWKIRFTAASMEIASGPEPSTALLDMAIFISAGKWALENYSVPQTLGASAKQLLPVYEGLERRIWDLVETELTPEQTTLLRDLISQWTAENPPNYEVANIRFRNLDGVRSADFQSPRNARGLLVSIRTWLGEVNTSLLFGERILFHLERTPRLLSQQTDLTLAQIGYEFPLTKIEPDLPALADYVEQLPARMIEEFTIAPLESDDLDAPLVNPLTGPVAGTGSITLPGIRETLQETRLLINDTGTLVSQTNDLIGSATTLNVQLQTTAAGLHQWSEQMDWSKINPADLERQLSVLSSSLASLEKSVTGLQALIISDQPGEGPAAQLLAQTESSIADLIEQIFYRTLIVIGVLFIFASLLIIFSRLGRRTRKSIAVEP